MTAARLIPLLAAALAACAPHVEAPPTLAATPDTRHGAMIVTLPPAYAAGRSALTAALQVDVFPGPDCAGDLTVGTLERAGAPAQTPIAQHFSCTLDHGHFLIAINPPTGSQPPWWGSIQFRVHGFGPPHTPLPPEQGYDATHDIRTVTVPANDPNMPQGIAVTRYVLLRP